MNGIAPSPTAVVVHFLIGDGRLVVLRSALLNAQHILFMVKPGIATDAKPCQSKVSNTACMILVPSMSSFGQLYWKIERELSACSFTSVSVICVPLFQTGCLLRTVYMHIPVRRWTWETLSIASVRIRFDSWRSRPSSLGMWLSKLIDQYLAFFILSFYICSMCRVVDSSLKFIVHTEAAFLPLSTASAQTYVLATT